MPLGAPSNRFFQALSRNRRRAAPEPIAKTSTRAKYRASASERNFARHWSMRLHLLRQSRRIDPYADAHGARDADLLEVDALGPLGPRFVQCLDQRHQVGLELLGRERCAPDRALNDSRFVGPILNLTGFGILDRSDHV